MNTRRTENQRRDSRPVETGTLLASILLPILIVSACVAAGPHPHNVSKLDERTASEQIEVLLNAAHGRKVQMAEVRRAYAALSASGASPELDYTMALACWSKNRTMDAATHAMRAYRSGNRQLVPALGLYCGSMIKARRIEELLKELTIVAKNLDRDPNAGQFDRKECARIIGTSYGYVVSKYARVARVKEPLAMFTSVVASLEDVDLRNWITAAAQKVPERLRTEETLRQAAAANDPELLSGVTEVVDSLEETKKRKAVVTETTEQNVERLQARLNVVDRELAELDARHRSLYPLVAGAYRNLSGLRTAQEAASRFGTVVFRGNVYSATDISELLDEQESRMPRDFDEYEDVVAAAAVLFRERNLLVQRYRSLTGRAAEENTRLDAWQKRLEQSRKAREENIERAARQTLSLKQELDLLFPTGPPLEVQQILNSLPPEQ